MMIKGLIASTLAKAGREKFGQLARRNDAAVADEFKELWDGVVIEVENRVNSLEGKYGDLESRLDNLQSDPIRSKIISNFDFEIVRESLPERIRMLAAAGISIAVSDFSVNRCARIERALRRLDDSDVRHLIGLRQAYLGDASAQSAMIDAARVEWENLQAAGCVSSGTPGFGGVSFPAYTFSQLGHDILIVLEDYLSEVGPLVPLEQLRGQSGE